MFNHVLSLCWIEEVSPSLSHIERGCIPLPCPGLPLSSFPPPIFPHSLTHPPLTQFNLISNLDTRQIKISGPLKLKTQIMCEHVRWPSLEVLVKVLGCQPPARDIRPNRYTTLTTHPNVSVYSIRNIFSKYPMSMYCFHPTQLWQNDEIGLAGLCCLSIPTVSLCESAGLSVRPHLTPLITEREIPLPWGRLAHYGPVD